MQMRGCRDRKTALAAVGPDAPGRAPRRLRADAQRNVGSLLEAAKAVFGTAGVDAPAKEIADLAGVGVGTLYRHFPQRSNLVKAVFQREVDACADAAPALAAAHKPGEALANGSTGGGSAGPARAGQASGGSAGPARRRGGPQSVGGPSYRGTVTDLHATAGPPASPGPPGLPRSGCPPSGPPACR